MHSREAIRFFVSYPDGYRLLAGRLAEEIENTARQGSVEAGVFLAFRDIPAGASWQGQIRGEIRRADCALFLWTDESSMSVGQIAELGAFWLLDIPRIAICYGVSPRTLPPYLKDCQAMFWADRIEHMAGCLEIALQGRHHLKDAKRSGKKF